MNETQEYQDPDDIFRDINLNEEGEVDEENCRLTIKRRGFRSSFFVLASESLKEQHLQARGITQCCVNFHVAIRLL